MTRRKQGANRNGENESVDRVHIEFINGVSKSPSVAVSQ